MVILMSVGESELRILWGLKRPRLVDPDSGFPEFVVLREESRSDG